MWRQKVTGPFSAPFLLFSVLGAAIITTKVDYGWAYTLVLSGLAALCSTYWVWKAEHTRGEELSEVLRPKLDLSFQTELEGCVKRNVTLILAPESSAISSAQSVYEAITSGRQVEGTTQSSAPLITMALQPQQSTSMAPIAGAITPWHSADNPQSKSVVVRGNYYRVRVQNIGGNPIHNCTGRLLEIKRDGHTLVSGESINLTFAPAEDSDTLKKSIRNGAPEFLDFLMITDENKLLIAARGFKSASSIKWDEVFRENGEYVFKIAVVTDGPGKEITIRLIWNGERDKATWSCP